jgi:hypothetical protein
MRQARRPIDEQSGERLTSGVVPRMTSRRGDAAAEDQPAFAIVEDRLA